MKIDPGELNELRTEQTNGKRRSSEIYKMYKNSLVRTRDAID